MAQIHWQLGEHEKAIALFEQSLETSKAIGDRSGESKTVFNLGSLYLDRHHYQDALDHFQRALVLQGELGQSEVLWRVFDSLSRTQAALDNHDLAILFGKQAVNTIQSMRSRLTELGKELQRSFLQDKTRVYRHLADILIDSGRLPEAQQVLDMLKEEEYADFISRASGEGPSTRNFH
jgi:tetratricopeptide (TPR) repeat protein